LIHGIHLLFRWSFISLFILFFGATLWLIYGVSLDRVEVGGYKVEKLYLKLDKKLTLRADRVILPKRKAKPSFSRIDKTFDNIRYMLALFEEISLFRVDFNNNRFALFYADDILYIRSKDYEIAGNLDRNGSVLTARIPMLFVKKYELYLQGDLHYDYVTGALETEGSYEIDAIKGSFRAVKKDGNVRFALNSEETEQIKKTVRRFALPSAIESWIVDKIDAKRYKIDYCQGAFEVDKNGIVDFKLDKLKAQVRAEGVRIRFHNAVNPATAERLYVRYQDHSLLFIPENASYMKRPLKGTTVSIKHLGDAKPATLYLDLHVRTDIEKEVHDILSAYGLHIPIRHNGKNNRIRLKLRIPLQQRQRGIKAELFATLDSGMLFIAQARFPVCKGGKIHYDKNGITIKRLCIQDWWYEGILDGDVDLGARRARLQLHLKRLALGSKKVPFLVLKEKNVPVIIRFKNDITIDIPKLAFHLKKHKEKLDVTLNDVSLLRPYIRNPLFIAKSGRVRFSSSDMIRFNFRGEIEKDHCIFYGKNGVCYVRIPLEGYYNGKTESLYFSAFGGRFTFDNKKALVRVRKLNIDLKRLLELIQDTAKKKKATLVRNHLVIEGSRSQIRYGRYRLVTDTYDIEIFPNGDIKAYGSLDGDVVKFTRKKGKFHVRAHRIKDTMLHPLINFTGLKGGRYSITLDGDPDKTMQGRIIVEGGVLSDFKAYNNTLAFINTVPALATLQRPGFSKKGFEIEAGVVNYRIQGDRLILEKVYLKGKTATVVGKGTVELKTGKVDVDLAIRTVKDFAKIVGNIPVVGYLLLGEDKSVTIGMKVTGTLENPKIETNVAKDILMLPVRMLERIITSPAKLDDTPTLPQLPPKNEANSLPRNHTSKHFSEKKTNPTKMHDGEMF
jgi:hypothetical protein